MHPYIQTLMQVFEKNANAAFAEGMINYLKNQFDFYGIKTPKRRGLLKEHAKQYGYPSYNELLKIIPALREYSKTRPDVVKKFVNAIQLQPLSRAEALKVIHRMQN